MIAMIMMKVKQFFPLLILIPGSFLLISCGSDDNSSQVQANFTSLYDNVFSGCGLNCHSSTATDGTENGPLLSTKGDFYTNLISKSPANYPGFLKGSDCTGFNYIEPGNASGSLLLGTLVQSYSDSIGATGVCTTSYNQHAVIQYDITDTVVIDALVTWINNGAANN